MMKEFWSVIQFIFAAVGGWLGWFLGGCDGLLYALIKGIFKKILIFLLVGIANLLDVNIIGNGSVLRTAAIFFYLSNEGVSLLENATHLGLPVPEKLKSVLQQLHDRAEED